MELQIYSPEKDGFLEEIKWNNEELKAEVAAKVKEYEGLVYTPDQMKEAKKDRADLRKFRTALEDERKRIKKKCMEPYDRFEEQVKEVIALVDQPIRMIDEQIKEQEEIEKQEKRKEIEQVFKEIGFQPFVKLEQIFDSKWLNKSVSLASIREEMQSRMFRIGDEVITINALPAFSFEAMEVYKDTLDINRAVTEGKRLADLQKRKEEAELKAKEAQQKEVDWDFPEDGYSQQQKEQTTEPEPKQEAKPEQTSGHWVTKAVTVKITAQWPQRDMLNQLFRELKQNKVMFEVISTEEK